MLKMLRFDFYKIFKSKALLSVFIGTLCLAFLDPLFFVLISTSGHAPFLTNLSHFTFLDFFILIFIVPFVCKDFSSKYIKNVYSSYSFADKIYYILSKAIYIFAISVIWFLLRFVSHLIINLIECKIYNCEFLFEEIGRHGVEDGLLRYFCLMINCFAKGMLCMCLCLLLKREYLVLIVVVFYWFFLSGWIYSALENAMGLVKGLHFVKNFTIYGMADNLPGDGSITISQLTQNTFILFGYSGAFAVLGWLCFFKRSY